MFTFAKNNCWVVLKMKNRSNLDTKQNRSAENSLTFAELELLTGTWLTGFLTLDHTRVAAHQTFGFQGRTILGIDLAERAADGEAEGLGLAVDATTVEVDLDVELTKIVGKHQRLLNHIVEDARREVLLVVALVHRNFTVTDLHIDAGNGGLSST